MEINQFVSNLVYGDAVSNDVLTLQKYLIELGYHSKIFVEFATPQLKNNLHRIHNYKGNKDSILIIHHSLYIKDLDRLKRLPDRKILRYHNITPAIFFPNDSYMQNIIPKGIRQAISLEKYCTSAFCASRYNEIELSRLGYFSTHELPIAINYQHYESINLSENKWSPHFANSFNVVCLGRIVENKNQHLVAKAFSEFTKNYKGKANLFLIGNDTGRPAYTQKIKSYVKKNNLTNIHITGKVNDEEMLSFYKNASCMVVFSDHEGFCVPLVEAMYFNVPIIAKNTSAIPYTLDNSGILVNNINELVEQLHKIASDASYKQKIIQTQKERLKFFSTESVKSKLSLLLDEIIEDKIRKKIQVKGPFETSYSLAQVNREFAGNLSGVQEYDVSIYASEGPGDYQPKNSDIEKLEANTYYLWQKTTLPFSPWMEIRNMWPPRANDFNSLYKTFYFAWEESLVPADIVKGFNDHLDAIFTTSESTSKALLDSGLTIPAYNIGESIRTNGISVAQKDNSVINLLHVSSCFPRKGVDKMIQAYCESFTRQDNVCLIIKTFHNPHNNVQELIQKFSGANAPKIELIMEDLSEAELEKLYTKSHIYLSPSRGEGFNRPVAEAMLRGLPVVVTAWGGHMDFCTPENSFLVNYTLEHSASHVKGNESKWAEPDLGDLKLKLKQAYTLLQEGGEALEHRKKIAREQILQKCNEETILLRFKKSLAEITSHPKMRIGHVSTWNIQCGISNYTMDLVEADQDKNTEHIIFANLTNDPLSTDSSNVIRCWHQDNAPGNNIEELYPNVIANAIDCLHIQFNFGFYNISRLCEQIQYIRSKGVKICITFHSTNEIYHEEHGTISVDHFWSVAHLVDRVYCFKQPDFENLSKIFSEEIISIIPHGINEFGKIAKKDIAAFKTKLGLENDFIISTHGFMLPHKGIDTIIEALSILHSNGYKNIKFLSVTSWHADKHASSKTFQKVKKIIHKEQLEDSVLMVDDFISQEDIYKLLSVSDLILFPYKPTNESASGAIRNAVLTDVPILTSKEPIFNDIEEFSDKYQGSSAEELASSVLEFYQNRTKGLEKLVIRKEYLQACDWKEIAKNINHDIRSLVFQ